MRYRRMTFPASHAMFKIAQFQNFICEDERIKQ
jgi:hypothetical protein